MARYNYVRILIPLDHSRGKIQVWVNPPYTLFQSYWKLIETAKGVQKTFANIDRQQTELYQSLITEATQAEYNFLSVIWFKGRQAIPMTKDQVMTLAELLGAGEFGSLITQTVCMIESHYAKAN